MPGLVPGIQREFQRSGELLLFAGLHCWLSPDGRGMPAGAPIAGLVLSTVAISDPPASRSDTRTVEGALARIAIRRADQGGRLWGSEGMADKPVVGVDVAKGWLDICVAGAVERIDNTAAAVLSWLDRVRPGLVACEPTGGYERTLLGVLAERAIPFVRVHPNQL